MGDTLLERALARLGRLVHRHAALVAAALILSLLPAGWSASRIEIRASFLDLLPEDEEPVVQLREVLAHARSTSDVVIAISTEDREVAERFARALVHELPRDPRIQGIGGRVDVDWLRDHQLMFVPEAELRELVRRAEEAIDREVIRRSGFDLGLDDASESGGETTSELLREVDERDDRFDLSRWGVTEDGRYLVVWTYFSGNTGDLEFGRDAWGRVRAAVDRLRDGERFPRDLEVRYAGGIPSRVEDERALVQDLRLAGSVGFVAVILLIVAALRAPRALVLLAVPLFVGLVWTFAFAHVAVGHLNIISGFLFSILSGLGIEYGIHLLHRYRELREEGLALEVAIERLVSTTGRALLSGSLTNASVFAVIAAAQFRGFSEFGLIAAVGLILTLVATLVGMPALLVLGERVRPMALPAQRASHEPLRVPAAVRWSVLVLVPAFAIGSVLALARGEVTFDGNWRLLAGESDATRFGEYLRHQMGGTYDAALLWVREDADLERVERTIDEVRAARAARGQAFDVVGVHTLADAFPSPDAQARRAELARALGEQLARIRDGALDEEGERRLAEGRRLVAHARPFTLEEMPYSVVGHLLTSDGRGSIAHARANETDDANTGVLVAWAAQARELSAALERAGIDAPMLSENWIAGEIFERIARDARFLAIGTFLAVLVVLLLDFRRPFAALAVLGSVLIGVVSIAGGLWLTGVRVNFMNSAILPVCVGISLDNAIHVYHRWREGGPGSIPMVLRHTTSANALASSTNLLGFAALVLAHHAGLRSVAFLATIGVVATYLSTTVWFPMVLDAIDRRRAARAPASREPGA